MNSAPPRLVPEKPFPPYAYVPGLFPHPTKDRRGHGMSVAAPPAVFDDRTWEEAPTFLYGIDLFNYGYYWEAHETWESLLAATAASPVTAEFVKALIKLAAAGVKVRESKTGGVQLHAKRAKEAFLTIHKSIAPETRHLGLLVEELAQFAEEIEKAPPKYFMESGHKPAVAVVFSYFLFPGELAADASQPTETK